MTNDDARLVLSLRVGPAIKLVWLYLRAQRRRETLDPFSVVAAANDLGMGRATIRRSLTHLENLGLITWQRSVGGDDRNRTSRVTIIEKKEVEG